MKTAAIIQARMTSSRLPGKVLMDICGKPALQRVVERTRAAKSLDDIIVATTINETDDPIIELCQSLHCAYFRGSENDVLSRVLRAAEVFEVDVIVEITADCPLIDWRHIDALVLLFKSGKFDHVSNIIERTFPRGFDIRVFSREALERTDKEVDNTIDRQHVSTWMYLNPRGKSHFKLHNWSAPTNQHRPDLEVTLDTVEDLELIRWLYSFEGQGYNLALTCEEVISLINTYPGMYAKVAKVQRKDYFFELKEFYLDITRPNRGAKKNNVPDTYSRRRKPGSISGHSGVMQRTKGN